MPELVAIVLTFVLIPAIAMLAGGVIAAYRPPGKMTRSYIQHFAAGVVLAAVVGEVLSDLHEQAPWAVALGFTLGVALMLFIRSASKRLFSGGEAGGLAASGGFVATVSVDIVVDGLLIGIGFIAGQEQGILITAALTIEVLFLGLAVATVLSQAGASRLRVIGTPAVLALLLAGSAVLGVALLGNISGAPLALVLSFAGAALLYLVVEELLIEAHEVPETPISASLFFLGFLVLFLIEMVAG